MKKTFFGLLLAGIVTMNSAVALDKGDAFSLFWRDFQTYVIQDDKEKVADMTRFPFNIDGSRSDRALFIDSFEKLFPPMIKKCLSNETPMSNDNEYLMFCNDRIYFFRQEEGTFKFIDIVTNN